MPDNKPVVTGKATEPTADEFFESLKTKKGKMNLLHESLGLAPDPEDIATETTETETPENVKPVKAVTKPVEVPNKEKVVKEDVRDLAAEKLAKALGLTPAPEVQTAEITAENEKTVKEMEKLRKRNQELERTQTIADETESYQNLLLTLPETEIEAVMAEIEALVAQPRTLEDGEPNPDYMDLSNLTVEKRTALIFGNAKSLAAPKLEKVREKDKKKQAEAEKVLKTVISGPAATETGGDEAKELKDLKYRADNGDTNAKAELIMRGMPGAKEMFDKIVKNTMSD